MEATYRRNDGACFPSLRFAPFRLLKFSIHCPRECDTKQGYATSLSFPDRFRRYHRYDHSVFLKFFWKKKTHGSFYSVE